MRTKGYGLAYGLLGPLLAYVGLFATLILWLALDAAGIVIELPIPCVGYLLGFGAAWWYVDRLTPREGFEHGADAPECPACGSMQTEFVGGLIQCYSCNELSEHSRS